MLAIVTVICLVLAGVVVVLGGYRALRDRPVATVDVAAAGLLALAVLVYIGVRVADLADGHRPSSLVVAIAYLIGIALVMPVAAALSLAERSRWGPLVLVFGALVVCVLFVRVDQVWAAARG